MTLHLPVGSLKTFSGLEPVPAPNNPLTNDLATVPSGSV